LLSILLISITFYTYLSNIVFSCDLAFKPIQGDYSPDTMKFPDNSLILTEIPEII